MYASCEIRECMPIDRDSISPNRDELDLSARIEYMYIASMMMIVATVDSLIIFILSIAALRGIYGWYPQFVAQQWFIYDQLLTVFSFLGMASGASATVLILSKRSYVVAVSSAFVCIVSGASILVISLIQPLALLWESILYYFLPLFVAPLTGTLLIYLQKYSRDKNKQWRREKG
jgi:hypothetical protein